MWHVVLSKRAARRLDKLLIYLETTWSAQVKLDFINKLDKVLKQIQEYPESCQQTSYIQGLYRYVVSKQTSVFYRFDAKTIRIVTIFDNRLNPKKLKEKTK